MQPHQTARARFYHQQLTVAPPVAADASVGDSPPGPHPSDNVVCGVSLRIPPPPPADAAFSMLVPPPPPPPEASARNSHQRRLPNPLPAALGDVPRNTLSSLPAACEACGGTRITMAGPVASAAQRPRRCDTVPPSAAESSEAGVVVPAPAVNAAAMTASRPSRKKIWIERLRGPLANAFLQSLSPATRSRLPPAIVDAIVTRSVADVAAVAPKVTGAETCGVPDLGPSESERMGTAAVAADHWTVSSESSTDTDDGDDTTATATSCDSTFSLAWSERATSEPPSVVRALAFSSIRREHRIGSAQSLPVATEVAADSSNGRVGEASPPTAASVTRVCRDILVDDVMSPAAASATAEGPSPAAGPEGVVMEFESS